MKAQGGGKQAHLPVISLTLRGLQGQPVRTHTACLEQRGAEEVVEALGYSKPSLGVIDGFCDFKQNNT